MQKNDENSKKSSPVSDFNLESFYRTIDDRIDIGALLVSKEGKILFANHGFLELLHTSLEKIKGTSLFAFIAEKDQTTLKEHFANNQEATVELSLVVPELQIPEVLLSVSPIYLNGSDDYCILITDLTDIRSTRQFMQTSESITKILGKAPPFSEALRAILAVLNKFLGWEIVIVWIWDKEKSSLYCSEIAQIPDIKIDSFAKKTKEMITGKLMMNTAVWASYRPYWIKDIGDDVTFLRRKEAMECNLRGHMAFPFYEDSNLSGILELFKRTPFTEKIDDTLINHFASLGIKLGLYFQKEKMERERNKLIMLINNAADGIYSMDTEGIVLTWNPTCERIYGWKTHEIIGKNIESIFTDDKLGEYIKLKKKLLEGKPIEHYEAERVRKDGKMIWVRNAVAPIKNDAGELVGACVVVHDISSQKALDTTLIKSDEKLRIFLELTKEWVWELDKEGYYQFSNQAVTRILGYEVEEVLGKNFLYFLQPEDRDLMEKRFKENVTQKQGWVNQTMRFIHKNGTERIIESNATELLNAQRKLIGFRGTNLNITESKSIEKIKNEFISVVNHELRTPLTSIYGALQLMAKEGTSPEEKNELIGIAKKNSERLTAIINDIMDIEKMELGKICLNFSRINLKDVVYESIQTSAINAKKFEVKVVAEEPIPDVYIQGDYTRLIQLMMNLLSNAIKFSPNGGIVRIAMSIAESKVTVAISDQGPGIPKEFQPKVFEMFAQADSSSKRSYQGTGLGLSICKSIIEAHNGKIEFKTKIGEGTTFYFELPIKQER